MKKLVWILSSFIAIFVLYFMYPRFKKIEPVSREKIYKMIEEKYPNSKKAQMAARQKADAYIRIANGDENYEEITLEGDKAIDCIDIVAPEYSATMYKWLEEVVFDNYPRYYLYEKYNHHFNGKVISIPPYGMKGCKFDPNNLH